MRSGRVVPLGLWLTTIVLISGAIRLAVTPTSNIKIAPELMQPARAPRALDHTNLSGNAVALRERNPFRLARTPTSRAFGTLEVANAEPATTIDLVAPSTPVLRIGGIVGGPPWSAVVEGVAGHEAGLLIRAGETLRGVHVRWVRNDSVSLSAGDSTWVLTLKRLEY